MFDLKQFQILKDLKMGWLDGDGVDLDFNGLVWLEQKLTELSKIQELPNIFLYPTSVGGVSLEYDCPGKDSLSLIIDLKNKTADLFAWDCEHGLTLDLTKNESWTKIFSYKKEKVDFSKKEENPLKALPKTKRKK